MGGEGLTDEAIHIAAGMLFAGKDAARALHEAVGSLRESGEASFVTWLPFIRRIHMQHAKLSEHGSRCPDRTQPGKFHMVTDDLESFLHVLGWMTLRYVPAIDSYDAEDRSEDMGMFDQHSVRARSGFKTVPTATDAVSTGTTITTTTSTTNTSASNRSGSMTPSGVPPPSGTLPGGGVSEGQRAASAGRRGVDVEKLKFRFVFVIWPVLMGITMAL
ncbi:hypothetical protein EV363DRAFT_1449474 [Boletus edulis]|nr:hypothetical protein EV363DRAFT_1449474 [Boletus edulis]